MSHTLQARIYQSLVDLIPSLNLKEARCYYAPARIAGDLAIHCTVDVDNNGTLCVEFVDDERTADDTPPKAWIRLKVDPLKRIAYAAHVQEGMNYGHGHTADSVEATRVNITAANWLVVFLTMGRMFAPIEQFTAR